MVINAYLILAENGLKWKNLYNSLPGLDGAEEYSTVNAVVHTYSCRVVKHKDVAILKTTCYSLLNVAIRMIGD